MDPAHFKVPVLVLQHHQIPVYVVGELALNYYNVLRACHIRSWIHARLYVLMHDSGYRALRLERLGP